MKFRRSSISDGDTWKEWTVDICECCGVEAELTRVHSIRGDDCEGHAAMCDDCRENPNCWPGNCEKPKEVENGG